MSEGSPTEAFSTPLGVENASPVMDARFTSASSSSDSSMEGRCLFRPITTTTTGAVENENEVERNIVLDYSSITNTRPAEEVLCLTEVEREEAEVGDTDSVASDEDMKELGMGVEEAIQDQLVQLVQGEDVEGSVSDDLPNWILKKGIGELSIPKPPDDWNPVDADVKAQARGAPSWKSMDNPGEWPEFTYRAKFKKGKNAGYTHHCIPTGARPLPANSEGKRTVQDWELHYKGWSPDLADRTNRSGASSTNLFPASRKGMLDYSLLKKMGLTKNRIINCDAQFFKQLLLPMCDPEKSGIEDDPRMPYYSKLERWSTKYAASIGLLGSYGHDFKTPNIEELVHWDSCVFKSGVNGALQGALFRRWRVGDTAYDPDVAASMTHTRWLQIKRIIKLCDNDLSPKRGEEGYCPAYKYDYLFKCLISNLNAITKQADLDQCGDETTCGHAGYGEPKSGILTHIKGKPGVTRGMQIVMLADVHRNRPRAYSHRHKVHANFATEPDGWTKEGMCEVRRIIDQITPLVEGEAGNGLRKIFSAKPHSTWDNYFSGDFIFDWMGRKGFPVTMTVRRDRLPSPILGIYLCKEKTSNDDKKSRVARFNHPITAVKICTVPVLVPAGVPPVLTVPVTPVPTPRTYTRVHVSFQSTSSCNIACVNSINGNSRFVRRKERGAGKNKRSWAIEMNEARQLYLATYGRIDTLDSMICKCNYYYRSWKYWHSPKLHGDAMSVVVAYDMYREMATELPARQAFDIGDDESFKVLDFHDFRDRLAKQGLVYSVVDCKYPGDSNMRANTRKTMAKRKTMVENEDGSTSPRQPGRPRKAQKLAPCEVTPQQLTVAKQRNSIKSRLCGDLTQLTFHEARVIQVKHPNNCAWCGEPALQRCNGCKDKPFLHNGVKRGPHAGKLCFLHHHNSTCFGLAKADSAMIGKQRKDWKAPTLAKIKANKKHIEELDAESAESTESTESCSD
jgi:hypothetical protein